MFTGCGTLMSVRIGSSSSVSLSRYAPRTWEWPNLKAAAENSSGMKGSCSHLKSRQSALLAPVAGSCTAHVVEHLRADQLG